MSNVFESSVGRSLVVSDIDDELARSFGVERNRHLRAYHAFAAVGAVVAGWLFAQWAREVGPGVLSPLPIFAFVVCAVAGMLLGPWGCMVAAVTLAFALGPAMVGRGAGGEMDGKSFLALILTVATIIAVWRGFDRLNAFARRTRRKLDPHLVDMATVDERSGMKGQGAPPPGTELLRFDRVAITQPTGPALRELSFSVHAGETLGIVADDPLRRRAILSVLGGQLQPDSGEVIVWSEAGRNIAQHDWVRHGIARTFSPPRLIEDFPVVDNVTVGASARLDAGVAPALVRLNQLADRTLRSEAVFHLSRIWMREYAQEMPADLPRGRRYLVELARALTADPALLVLDHPSENLESRAERDTAVGLVRDLIDSGLAVVVVDRDVTLLREMVGQLLVVDGGGEVACGATERVLAQPGVRVTLEAFK
jgi:branched-chain amino acid transport system permease protein